MYGTKCRYDGQGYNDKVIQSLKDYVDIQTVCPELAIGLSIILYNISEIGSSNRWAESRLD